MAKRLYVPKQQHNNQQSEHPRPHGWHDWLREARREAEAGKHTYGRAVVRAVRPRKAKAPRYTRAAWRKMTLAERVDVLAERLGVLEGERSQMSAW